MTAAGDRRDPQSQCRGRCSSTARGSRSLYDGGGHGRPAGNINVQAARMTLDNGATVSAASTSTGDAGTITINARGPSS